jgi:rRNA pseudouridine-1189 N-methylase Emg1 (Nep1/Mra1 family)
MHGSEVIGLDDDILAFRAIVSDDGTSLCSMNRTKVRTVVTGYAAKAWISTLILEPI